MVDDSKEPLNVDRFREEVHGPAILQAARQTWSGVGCEDDNGDGCGRRIGSQRRQHLLAGRIGDGYWGTAPSAELLDTFEQAGGRGPRYAQLTICWAEDEDDAKKTVRAIWPTAGLSGQLSQDLPTWSHFEDATEPLTIEQVRELLNKSK